MNSLHDHEIYKYEVLSSERKIVLHSKFELNSKQELGTVVFEGVLGHHFEHALEGNIVLSLEETDKSVFYNHNKTGLQRYQKYGLPLDTTSSSAFKNDMKSKALKVFQIFSSCGLAGWVLATTCSVSIKSGEIE